MTTALPTFDDEAALHGYTDPAATRAGWRAAGTRDVVVKLVPAGCVLDDGRIVAPAAPVTPVDTTGAGDAFNADYLAARRRGASATEADTFTNRLARRPRDRLPRRDPAARRHAAILG